MKGVFLRIVVGLVALYALVYLIAPGIVELKYNTLAERPPYELSEADQAFYDKLEFVADLHSDALLWGRDLNQRSSRGHVDIPRMQEANIGLQAFTVVTKTPRGQNYRSNTDDTDNITSLMIVQGRHPRTWTSLLQRGLDMSARLHQSEANNPAFQIIKSQQQFQTYLANRKQYPQLTAGLLGIEGLHLLEGDAANFEVLYEAGFRMMAPVHFFDNKLGGSAHGEEKGGLTPFGKTVLAKAEAKGVILDLAHAAVPLMEDVLASYNGPILTSHTGVQAICPGDRNLSDAMIRAIAAKGGLIGIAMFPQAVCSDDLAGTVAAMRHVADLVGVDPLALGSDFDGAVQTPVDITGLKMLVPALRKAKFADEEIRAIMGGNVRRFLLQNLPTD